ncbi:MAG: GNAT family N-acetyltransferase [Gemmatimonadaceae bacterium]
MLVSETERLQLRHLAADDAPFILGLLNDPEFLRFIGDKKVRSISDAVAYISNGPMDMYHRLGFGLFLTELRDSHTPVGLCGLIKRDGLDDVDIGFAFLDAYRGRGYAFEAAQSVMQFAARTLKLERVVAITTLDNERSGKLLERLGLTFERLVILPNSATELRLYGGRPANAPPPLP